MTRRGSRLWLAAFLIPIAALAQKSDEIRFEIAAVAGLERHVALLERPGYAAVALENNDLSPSVSSKLVIRERGREVEARNATFRYVGRKGERYAYEAGLSVGIGDTRTRLTMPVVVDVSALPAGKLSVVVKPPLAVLLPVDVVDRIQVKMRAVANAAAQQKMIEYLDRVAKGGDAVTRYEDILLDAYNRGGGPGAAGRDAGDALPLSDQWMLIVSVFIWLVVAPALLLCYRLRWRRKPA